MAQRMNRCAVLGIAVLLGMRSVVAPAAEEKMPGVQRMIGAGFEVEGGVFMKDGQPFRGVGINYFSAFLRKLGMEGTEANLADRSYREGFKTLRQYEIPFIRFCAGGFWPREWASYQTDKAAYFEALDQLVADAEEAGLGLIPTFFWCYSTIPDLVGEPLDQWGNPESKTMAFMRQYTTEVVSRYKDSPAIWAWEFGNEYIMETNLPEEDSGRGLIVPEFGTPSRRTARDKMYRRNIWRAYQEFAHTIRVIDPARPVLSGDTMPRSAAFHNWSEGSWTADSKAEWTSIFLNDNAAMDALEIHFYYYDKERHAGFKGFGPAQQLPFVMDISRMCGKPLFIGEFGPSGEKKTKEEEQRQFEFLLNLIVENKVPLSALWNFDFEHVDQSRFNITKDNHRAYMLNALRKANRKLKNEQ